MFLKKKLFCHLQNEGIRDGSGARLHDYFEMRKLVERAPTIQDKINLVNPYERPWSRFEKTWHRYNINVSKICT